MQQLPADSQAVPTGAVPGSAALSASQNQTRGRAVRLLREAAAVAPSSVSMSSGELAFALEKAAMEAFGAGQPRYFEFVTRYAMRLKVCVHSPHISLYSALLTLNGSLVSQ